MVVLMSAHAEHAIHEHSRDAYREEYPKLAGRKAQVYEWIAQHGPSTDREVMEGLGYSDMNSVRPRISELVAAGILIECTEHYCDLTGRLVRVLDLPTQQLPLI